MPKICIFCTKKDKKHNGSKQKLISVEAGDFEEKTKKYATTLGDQALLSKLGSVDFVVKEIRHHGICRTKYQTAPEQVSKKSQNKEAAKRSINLWHRGREVHSQAFKSICSLVEAQVITGGNVLDLKDAFNNYVSVIEDLDAESLVASYTAQELEEKLKLHFKERIIIHKEKYKRGGSLIYNSIITLEETLKLADLQKSKLDQRIKGVELSLRAIIKNATCANLPSSGITFDDIIDGEVQIPEQLTQFFTHLVSPDHRSHESTSKIRRVESLAAGTVFSVTDGRKKCSKHLKLGPAVKSMTRTKKLIGMLNRYGHCVSYTTNRNRPNVYYQIRFKDFIS